MTEKNLTHKDLSHLLKVSETTIKSYRRKFADCIPVASQGKPIRFTPEAAKVCLRIRDLFDTGMSVAEVRARLAEEFTWISLISEEKEETASPTLALPQDFTQAISNLAKGMVTLTQQQGTMIKRIEDIESTLSADAAQTRAMSASREGSSTDRQDGSTVASLLSEEIYSLQRLLQDSLSPLAGLTVLDGLPALAESLQTAISSLHDVTEKLYSFGTHEPTDNVPATGQQSKVVRFPSGAEAQEAIAYDDNQSAQDPPRQLLTAPLVVRTAQGGYISAGGKSRGMFSANDLKAMLAFAATPQEHYTISWEDSRDGWWVSIDQLNGDDPHSLRLLLRELTAQSGLLVAEIIQLVDNGRSGHPAEICGFIADIGGE